MILLRRPALSALLFALVAPLSAQVGWTAAAGAEPSARAWPGMTEHRGRNSVLLFGGWNGTPRADTWEWGGSSWTPLTTGAAPPGRCCFDMAYDPDRGVVVLFGGTDGMQDLADTWEWSAASGWRQVFPQTSPPARRLHRLAFDPVRRTVVLFGGGQTGLGNPLFNDTWEYDGTDWTQLQPSQAPSARWYHSMATDWSGGRIVLFGGTDTRATGGRNDLWVWEGSDWSQAQTTGGPSVRHDASFSQDPATGDMLLYGGWNGTQFFRDTWSWNGYSWRALSINTGPSARRGMAMASDFGSGRVLAFGGYTTTYLGGTWLHRGQVFAAYDAFGSGCPGSAGTPTLAPRNAQRPVLGQSLDVVVSKLPAGAATVMVLGTSRTTWNQQALPLDLTGFGATGCSLLVSPDVSFGIANANGMATWTLSLPNNPFLVGFEFYNQALVRDVGVNPLGLTTSNAGRGRIGY